MEIGVVGRPHGVDGKIRIYLHNSESNALVGTQRFYLDAGQGPESRVLPNLRESANFLVGCIEGCSSRTEAEQLKGAKILIARKEFPDLEEDEFYVDDLIGLEAWEGELLIGKVVSSRRQGDIEVVTVKNEAYEVGIPLVDAFVVSIEFDVGRILFCDTDRLPRDPIRRKTVGKKP